MANITFNHFNYQYENQLEPVFTDLTLTLDTQWKCAIVARNGRGKSTLLKLIAGQLPANTRQLQTVDNCGYFPLTVNDESLYPMALFDIDYENQWKVEREMQLLKIETDKLWQPYQQLSGGERVKIMLAILFSGDYEYIVLDEPTIYLDLTTRQLIHSYLKDKQGGFLIISHDSAFLDGLIDHVIGIEANSIEVMQGSYQQYYEEKAHKDQFFQQQNDKIKQEIKRLKQSAAEKSQWSNQKEKEKAGNPKVKNSKNHMDKGFIGARSARTMKRARHLEKQIDQQIKTKQSLLNNVETVDELTMNAPLYRYSPVYSVDKLSLAFDEGPLFKPVTFTIQPKDCLVIRGDNGVGKSTLLSYLTSQFSGQSVCEFEECHPIKMSYLAQFFAFTGTLEELAEQHQLDYQQLVHNVRQLGMSRRTLAQTVDQMSCGERQKVALAASLATVADLYIWDEPLTYLDIYNQEQLVALIKQFQPTLVLVDHNEDFVNQVKTAEVSLEKP